MVFPKRNKSSNRKSGKVRTNKPMQASGGIYNTGFLSGSDYAFHIFESDGTFTINRLSLSESLNTIEYLVVGNGGNGGDASNAQIISAGAGGPGGMVFSGSMEITGAGSWEIYVGTYNSSASYAFGLIASNSLDAPFAGVNAPSSPNGAGGSYIDSTVNSSPGTTGLKGTASEALGNDGGSAAYALPNGTFDEGQACGAGGGASMVSAGGNASAFEGSPAKAYATAGAGADGVLSSITCEDVYYGSGGSGGVASRSDNANRANPGNGAGKGASNGANGSNPATSPTTYGSGGGGGCYGQPSASTGSLGVVIIRYPLK